MNRNASLFKIPVQSGEKDCRMGEFRGTGDRETPGGSPDPLGALPQTPAGNVVPCTLSSLRAGFNPLKHTTRMRVVQ